MLIRDLTQTEADYLEVACNFTDEELALFHQRLKDVPLEDCAERMNVSLPTIKRLAKRISAKIIREI